eukprot:GHVU01111756.1.p1 GENE.GHVU01111756.1~~GHVU01111756.1.p1  ORF type:complete len:171 (+),score=15.40 GHVU01111756.1:69-581(+)
MDGLYDGAGGTPGTPGMGGGDSDDDGHAMGESSGAGRRSGHVVASAAGGGSRQLPVPGLEEGSGAVRAGDVGEAGEPVAGGARGATGAVDVDRVAARRVAADGGGGPEGLFTWSVWGGGVRNLPASTMLGDPPGVQLTPMPGRRRGRSPQAPLPGNASSAKSVPRCWSSA